MDILIKLISDKNKQKKLQFHVVQTNSPMSLCITMQRPTYILYEVPSEVIRIYTTPQVNEETLSAFYE